MKKFKVKVEFEREVEAKDIYEADEKFWEELDFEMGNQNMDLGVLLTDNMSIREKK